MKKLVLIVLFIFLQFGYATTPDIKINHPEHIKIISIKYENNEGYEKEVYCIVTIEVNGQTYVGRGTGLTIREACDKAYAIALDFAQQ